MINKKADSKIWIVVLLIIIILLLGVIVFFVLGKNIPLANNQNNPLNNQQALPNLNQPPANGNTQNPQSSQANVGEGTIYCYKSIDSLTLEKCPNPVATDAGSPGAMYDGENMRVYFHKQRDVYMTISKDGDNWEEQKISVSGLPNGIAVEDPEPVLLDNGKIRLYFYEYVIGQNSATRMENFTIGSAISDDGINFIVEPGARNTFERIMDPNVVKMGDVWRMYNSQVPYNLIGEGKVFSFISYDNGMSFQFEKQINVTNIIASVIEVPEGYRMYYNDHPAQPPMKTYSAFSSDGVNWKEEGVRIIGGGSPAILKKGNEYWYFFAVRSPQN